MKSFERVVVDKVEKYIIYLPDSGMEVLGKRIGLWRFKKLKEKLPDFNFQPDIDILLRLQNQEEIIGVEVKTIYLRKGKELNAKIYNGLEEALSLLRFGLDKVTLFQVFLMPLENESSRNKMIDAYLKYSIPMRDIIRTLNLPISYTPAYDYLINEELSPSPIRVLDLKEPNKSPRDKQVILRSKAKNPFLNSQLTYPKLIRDFIVDGYVREIGGL